MAHNNTIARKRVAYTASGILFGQLRTVSGVACVPQGTNMHSAARNNMHLRGYTHVRVVSAWPARIQGVV